MVDSTFAILEFPIEIDPSAFVSVLKAFGSILKILFCASVIGGKIYLRSGNAFKNFNLSFLICSRQKHL